MHKVLIVDDLTSDIKLVMECLKDIYQLSAATTGEKAIELAVHNRPDVILMDVSMPIMNGYDTCKQILKRVHSNIIFLSANDRTDEILQGYDAGGIDYIIKPFDPVVLREKIAYAISRERLETDILPQPQLEADFNLQWLSGFIDQCKSIHSPLEIAEAAVARLKSLNYLACIQLHSDQGIFEASYQGSLSKLESEILTRQLQEDGHIFEGAQGLFITFESVALLIKNPPESFELLEPIKLKLAALVQSINAMLFLLDKSSSKQSRLPQTPINQSTLVDQINNLEQLLRSEATKTKISVQIIESVLAQIEQSFVSLGLTFSQEQTLLGILNSGIDNSVTHYEQGMAGSQIVLNQLEQLRQALHQQS